MQLLERELNLGNMNIESMPLVGFEFFKEYFISRNKQLNIIKDLEQTKNKKVT